MLRIDQGMMFAMPSMREKLNETSCATENFESGIRKTVLWYLENNWWWQRVLSGAYQNETMSDRSKDVGQ